jgi:vitamin B12 transporter
MISQSLQCAAVPAALRCAAVPAALLLVAGAARADELADDTILVSVRAPVAQAEAGVSVSVLTGADLERLQVPLLLDALRLQPGVTISRNGGAGGFASVRIRGAEGEQTTLVIDGVKVADPASPGGGADFANLVSAGIARVEILRGAQSLAWGSQAIGGVVAVETVAPTDELEASARAEGGSRNSWLGQAAVSGRVGPVGLAIGGNWQRTDGISAFAESRGGTERDDFESFGANARATVAIAGGLSADLRGRFQSAEFGVDGFAPPSFAFGDTPDRGRSREASGIAGLRYEGEAVTARAGWQISDVARRSFTPGNEPETSFRSLGRFERLDAQASWRVSPLLTLAGGAEREVSRLATRDAFSQGTFRARTTIWGGFVQAKLVPIEGVDLLGGVRHDEHARFGGATTFGASASLRPWTAPVRLKGSWGEGFKAPTLYQLFSEYGNEALRPERATAWDLGAELDLETLVASATWFERRTRNQIDFVSCFSVESPLCDDGRFGFYENVARTRAKGLELVAGVRPVAGLRLDAQYSFTDARNRSEGTANFGRFLARRPQHSLSALVDWTAPAGWSLGATLAHVSSSFDNASNSQRLPGYVTADIRGSWPVTQRLEIYGRVTNLFDEVYETARLYGQPGRQAVVGLRARL